MKASRLVAAAVLSVAAISAHADEFAYKFSAGCTALMLVKYQQTNNPAFKGAAEEYMKRTQYGIQRGEIADRTAGGILEGVGTAFRNNPNDPAIQNIYNQCVKTGRELGYLR